MFTKTQSLIIWSRAKILKLERQAAVKPYFEPGELKKQMVNDIKLLGVNIGDKLQLGWQVEEIKAKSLQALSLIKHVKHFFLEVICRKCIQELLSRILAIVARFNVVELISASLSLQE